MARRCSWFRVAGSLAVLCWAAPASLWSQSAPAVAAGDTVRILAPPRIVIPDLVTLEGGRVESRVPREEKDGLVVVRDGDRTLHVPRPGQRVTGRLVGVTGDAVILRGGGDRTISIPREAVERLEVKRGGKPKTGALVGAAAGFAIGFAIGYAAEKDCSGTEWCMPGAAGAGLGLLLAIPGAGVGALVAGGRWEPVAVENVRVAVAPRRGGAAAGVTIRF